MLPTSTLSPSALGALAVLIPLSASAQDLQDLTPEQWTARATGGWLSLPEEPYGRVFAALGAETVPKAPPREALAALAPGAAERPETWALWRATLLRVAAGPGADPALEQPPTDQSKPDRFAAELAQRKADAEVRAAEAHAADLSTLALIAAGQRRADDAWRWLAAHGPGSPEHVAGTLAFLMPGVPVETPIGPGGRPGPIAPGALLTPLAPPRPAGVPEWRVVWRSAEFRGLTVGATVFDGKVVVESSGSEVRITHRSGEAATLSAQLAGETGFDFGGRYYDWEQLPADAPLVAKIALAPGDEEHVYWGRFIERKEQRPSLPPPGTRPAQLELGGLGLIVAHDDPRRELVDRIGTELTQLLGIRVWRVASEDVARRAAEPLDGFAPIWVHVPAGDAGARTLAALASSVEAFLVPR
jgi:hypothetical protein